MNNTRINKIKEAIKAAGLESMLEGLTPILSEEITRAAQNRMIQILALIAKGYEKEGREINFEVVRVVVGRFLELSKGLKKDAIKHLYNSFTLVPRFSEFGWSKSKTYRNLTTEEKDRDSWGKRAAIETHLGEYNEDIYLKYIKILKAAKRKPRG